VPYEVFDTTMKQLYEDFKRTKEIGDAFFKEGISNSDQWVRERMSRTSQIIYEGLAVLQLQANTTMTRLFETLFKLPERTRSDLDQESRLRRSLPSSVTTAEEHDNSPPGSTRNRRFVEAIIGIGASIIGAIWDIYKTQDIKNIKKGLLAVEQRVNQQHDLIQKLLHVQLDHSKILQEHAEYQTKVSRQLNIELNTDPHGTMMKLRALLGLVEDQARIFGDTVKMALLGKLNPDQVSYETMMNIAEFIWTLEDTHNLHSPIKEGADIFTMPLSYLYNLKSQRLEFIIHVPMYRAEQLLDMYEYQPFPMTLSIDRSKVAIPRPGGHNILAYNANSEFMTMTSTDLQSCFVLRRVHYCPNRQILRTDWSKTCLSALYKMNQEAATRYCDFQIQPADERVLKLDANNYLVYTNRQLVAEKHCGKQHTSLSIKEGTLLQIDNGCHIQLDDHHIYGDAAHFVQSFQPPAVFTWDWDAQRVLRNHSGDDLKNAISNLQHESGGNSFETEDLEQQIQILHLQEQQQEINRTIAALDRQSDDAWKLKLENPGSFFHWISIGISMAVTFVAVTLVAICLRFRFRQYAQRKQPTHQCPGGVAIETGNAAAAIPRTGFFRF